MFKARLFAHFFFALTGMASASVVWAAVAPPDLAGLPWPQIGIGVLLALWGGVTRTAERALEASRAGRESPPVQFDLRQELVKDVIVSSGVGFLVFLVGAWQGWGVWLLPAALWLGGYLGTRLLARLGDAALANLSRRAGAPGSD